VYKLDVVVNLSKRNPEAAILAIRNRKKKMSHISKWKEISKYPVISSITLLTVGGRSLGGQKYLASSSFQFALGDGGVGLSGVGYGLFGLLYVLSKHDDRFKECIDQRTVNLFLKGFSSVFLRLSHIYSISQTLRMPPVRSSDGLSDTP
jgi:hypothetical protein